VANATGRVETFGIAHYRVEFADAVREAIHRLRPAALAVELPSTLEKSVLRAVRRLPELSVVLYTTRAGEAVYLPIEPTDPIIEAIRSGLEQGIPVSFVDLDVDDYPDYREALPDPWAITRIGADAYAQAYQAQRRPRGPLDVRRERGMAWRARRLAARQRGTVLLVCGLAHVEGVEAALQDASRAEPLARVRREGISVWNLEPECLPQLLGEMPFVAAVYERRRRGIPERRAPETPLWLSRRVGPFRILEARRAEESQELREAVERTAGRADVGAHPEGGGLDRMRVVAALFDEAEARYATLTGERVSTWQRRGFARFVRRLATMNGVLVPDLHDLIVAARGCVDDNLAYETWRLGSTYPWQRSVSDLPTARLSGADLRLGTQQVRLRRRLARPGRHEPPFRIRRRRGERWPGEWIASFQGEGICSYPPEDVVVESFGRHARDRGTALLREEHSSSKPFSVSLGDGLDVRETLRRWHEGDIWVREARSVRADVGSVVVIFDEDPDGTRYPFLLTWLGEHDKESDMALYATDPCEAVVGPGICRAQYGGFLLSYPPRRMADVWSDPAYAIATSKPEKLVLAALDYSIHAVVVLASRRPPSSRMKSWAAQLDRRLVYLPFGLMAPATLKRLRVLHVLDGRSRRETARDYIW
jgi:hypothetical protein